VVKVSARFLGVPEYHKTLGEIDRELKEFEEVADHVLENAKECSAPDMFEGIYAATQLSELTNRDLSRAMYRLVKVIADEKEVEVAFGKRMEKWSNAEAKFQKALEIASRCKCKIGE